MQPDNVREVFVDINPMLPGEEPVDFYFPPPHKPTYIDLVKGIDKIKIIDAGYLLKTRRELVDKPPFEKPPIGLGFIPKDVEHVSKK